MSKVVSPAVVPVILCGGEGARLWPLSRATRPKPFVKVGQYSLYQQAVLRAVHLPQVSQIMIVAHQDMLFDLQAEINQLTLPDTVAIDFLLEPCRRNTAMAVLLATLHSKYHYKTNTTLWFLTADHVISPQKRLHAAVLDAAEAAKQNNLVLFGVRPTIPSAAYGYFEVQTDNTITGFIEKPNVEEAQCLLDAGNYYWNSGMLCAKCDTLTVAFSAFLSDALQKATVALQQAQIFKNNHRRQLTLPPEPLSSAVDISLDHAILEKSDNLVAVILKDIAWQDVGDWMALSTHGKRDKDNNIIMTPENNQHLLLENSKDCIIYNHAQRLLVTLGVQSLLIADTADAVLIADKAYHQQIKTVYAHLKQQQRDEVFTHRHVNRPWGSYSVLAIGKGYKVKRIVVNAQQQLSLQSHQYRSEHWCVVEGVADIINDTHTLQLKANESTFIAAGHKHRLSNNTSRPLVIIEIQVGHYVGEDDIIRYCDDYQRPSHM